MEAVNRKLSQSEYSDLQFVYDPEFLVFLLEAILNMAPDTDLQMMWKIPGQRALLDACITRLLEEARPWNGPLFRFVVQGLPAEGNPFERERCWIRLAACLSRGSEEEFTFLETQYRSAQDSPGHSPEFSAGLALSRGKRGQFRQALEIISRIPDSDLCKGKVLGELAQAIIHSGQAEKGHLERVLALVERVEGYNADGVKAKARVAIIRALAASGNPEGSALLVKLVEEITEMNPGFVQCKALREVCKIVSEFPGGPYEAKEMYQKLRQGLEPLRGWERSLGLQMLAGSSIELADHRAAREQILDALSLAEKENNLCRELAIDSLSKTVLLADDLPERRRLPSTLSIDEKRDRSRILIKILENAGELENVETASWFFDQAYQAAEKMAEDRHEVFTTLAKSLMHACHFPDWKRLFQAACQESLQSCKFAHEQKSTLMEIFQQIHDSCKEKNEQVLRDRIGLLDDLKDKLNDGKDFDHLLLGLAKKVSKEPYSFVHEEIFHRALGAAEKKKNIYEMCSFLTELIRIFHALPQFQDRLDEVTAKVEVKTNLCQYEFQIRQAKLALAQTMALQGKREAWEVFRDGVLVFPEVSEEDQKFFGLEKKALMYSMKGDFRRARQAADEIKHSNGRFFRFSALAEIAHRMAKAGMVTEALEIAQEINDGFRFGKTIMAVTRCLSREGDPASRTAILSQILAMIFAQKTFHQGESLGGFLAELVQQGDPFLNEMEQSGMAKRLGKMNAHALEKVLDPVMDALRESGRIDECQAFYRGLLGVLDFTGEEEPLETALKCLARPLKLSRDQEFLDLAFEKLVASAGKIGAERSLAQVLEVLAGSLNPLSVGWVEAVEKLANGVGDNYCRGGVTREIIRVLVSLDKADLAARKMARISDNGERSTAFGGAGEAHARMGRIKEAWGALRKVSEFDWESKDRILAGIAVNHVEKGKLKAAKQFWREITTERQRRDSVEESTLFLVDQEREKEALELCEEEKGSLFKVLTRMVENRERRVANSPGRVALPDILDMALALPEEGILKESLLARIGGLFGKGGLPLIKDPSVALKVSPSMWKRILQAWREELLTGHAPGDAKILQFLRESLVYHLPELSAAKDGVWALCIAHYQAGNLDHVREIARRNPELGLQIDQ